MTLLEFIFSLPRDLLAWLPWWSGGVLLALIYIGFEVIDVIKRRK